MKKAFGFILSILLTANSYAQLPQKMSYQSVIRNSSEQLVTNHAVGIRISILRGSEAGLEVYKETFNPIPHTNANGLVSIEIGTGVPLTGTFADIDWSTGIYFIKTETDPTGGTTYSIVGISQILSVPYALHARTADSVSGGIMEKEPLFVASAAMKITNEDIAYWNSKLDSITQNIPVLTTSAISDIKETSAICGGSIITDGGLTITERGVCWSKYETPTIADNVTIDGAGAGVFSSSLTGLTGNTIYYLRAYSTTSKGTGYGMVMSFKTAPKLATITTMDPFLITSNTMSCGGFIIDDGGSSLTTVGVCWSISQNPFLNYNIPNFSVSKAASESFVCLITGLLQNTKYYIRSFAINSAGTTYGNELFITTLTLPILTTIAVSSITDATANCGGNISNEGSAIVTERGVCWSKNLNPTINDYYSNSGSASLNFRSPIFGLLQGTKYNVRAYAKSIAGTAYGDVMSFTTLTLPSITTTAISNIANTSVDCGGNITNQGSASVTERGVCWGNSINPTIANNKISSGLGIGQFSIALTGLSAATTYHVRAFATNNISTSYGQDIIFTTSSTGITIIDSENNVYNTVTIGNQVWMVENLKTTKYNDNSYIPLVSDALEWGALSSPGYCWYSNDELSNKNNLGALYNWYTVNTNMLCPKGWHVPTNEELQALTFIVGNNSGKLKEIGTTHWLSPNYGATNETGFTALPAGFCSNDGLFKGIGINGCWWSSNEFQTNSSFYLFIQNGNTSFGDNPRDFKRNGYSVRCLRN